MDNTLSQDWVSAAATRNYLTRNPLVDWLSLYGKDHGFKQDDELPSYDLRTDFASFILRQGNSFEAAVVRHLASHIPILTISSNPGDVTSVQKAEETVEAMAAGHPLIAQGVLRDPGSQTYGAPDFLIRSDVLNELFPCTFPEEETFLPAPGIRAERFHYRVVDAKFTTLELNAGGSLGNGGSSPAYKAHFFVYNRALGNIQGYTPPVAYLLGRGWRQTRKRNTVRGTSCMDRLGPCRMDETISGRTLENRVNFAAEWIRRVRNEGKDSSTLL